MQRGHGPRRKCLLAILNLCPQGGILNAREELISMETTFPPGGERLGPTDPLGVAFTVGELIAHLSRLNPTLPVFSGRNDHRGIALHHHAFVDPSKDYVSFTHLNSSVESSV